MHPTKRLVGPPDSPDYRRVPPYDTGKVKIGLCYTPPANWSASRDSLTLQAAFLSRSAVRPPFTSRIADFFRSLV